MWLIPDKRVSYSYTYLGSTREGARARGRKGGRPKLNPSVSKVAMAKKLYADQTNSIRDICRTLHISRATLYRYLKAK
jgi:DNA invertase Pin-like site-specific DNA recombinase